MISPSRWLLNFYKEKGFFKNSKLVHLPNPIETKEKIEKQEAGNNFLFIGQLEEHKGIIFLIETLKQSDLDFHLIIAGEGREIEKIKEIIRATGDLSYWAKWHMKKYRNFLKNQISDCPVFVL